MLKPERNPGFTRPRSGSVLPQGWVSTHSRKKTRTPFEMSSLLLCYSTWAQGHMGQDE